MRKQVIKGPTAKVNLKKVEARWKITRAKVLEERKEIIRKRKRSK